MSNCLLQYLAITAILLSWLSPRNCWLLLSLQCILLRNVNKLEFTSLVIRFGLSTVLKQFSTLQGTRSLGGLPHSNYGETILSWYLPAVYPMVVDGRVNRVNRLVPWFWVVVRISVFLVLDGMLEEGLVRRLVFSPILKHLRGWMIQNGCETGMTCMNGVECNCDYVRCIYLYSYHCLLCAWISISDCI